jgi:hypothetical protein
MGIGCYQYRAMVDGGRHNESVGWVFVKVEQLCRNQTKSSV